MNNKNEIQLWSFVEFKEYKQIWDLDTDNVFYSMGRNRFYIFDPILLKK